jgi:hypothetical protein
MIPLSPVLNKLPQERPRAQRRYASIHSAPRIGRSGRERTEMTPYSAACHKLGLLLSFKLTVAKGELRLQLRTLVAKSS